MIDAEDFQISGTRIQSNKLGLTDPDALAYAANESACHRISGSLNENDVHVF